MTINSEETLYSLATQQAFRRDVESLFEADITRLLQYFRPAVAESKHQEVGDTLVRGYEDLVRGIRMVERGQVEKTDPIFSTDNEVLRPRQKLATRTAQELLKLRTSFDELTETLAQLSSPARKLIDAELRRLCGSSRATARPRPSLQELSAQAFEPLNLIATAADRVSIETKRGPDHAPLHQLVVTLVALWNGATGALPRRSYDERRKAAPGKSGESGAFLDLVRDVVGLADRTLKKEGLRVRASSLSRIVRDVLAKFSEKSD